MKRQRAWIITFLIGLLLVFTVIVPAAVVTSKKKHNYDDKNAYPVDVILKSVQDSEISVQIINNGPHDINLFARGTILDPNPVIDKLNVVSANGTVPRFIGVHPEISKNNLSSQSFHPLPPKWSADFTIDVAYLFDMSEGGEFDINAMGIIPFADPGSTTLSGNAVFSSNKMKLNISKGMRPSLERTVLQADCVGSMYSNTIEANAMCALISTVAGHSALSGDPERFFRYFRTYDAGMRRTVANRFFAVADECAGRTRVSTTFCTDQLKLCQSDYIAVTLGTRITNCDIFWRFPLITNQCHGYDRATVVIHEVTHVDGLLDPSTVDFADNYGWPKLTYLNAAQAVTNADNYQYFANAVTVGGDC